MSWNVDVSQYLFAIGNCGGPIALTNHSKSSTATSQQVFTNTVQTFSATGQRLATMQWNKGLIVQLFWSSKCNLVVVVEDGIIYTYDAWGEFISSFSLEKTLKTQKILECKGQEDVLVFLSTDLKFYRVTNLADPRPQKMAVITTMKSPPSSWCIVNPKVPDDSRLKILVASKNRVYIVDDLNFLLQPYESRTYTHIAISPSGKLVALLSSDGAFSVTTLDFKKNLSKTFTDIAYPPSQLAWCGVDSVVACWDNLLVMMGPAGTWTTFSYESQHVIVNTEMDGLRIFSATSHDFLQKVPEVSVQALLPDSNRPAALLLKAYKFFKEKNCKADELIRQVRKDLKEAVQNCVEAARSEFDIRN